MYSPIYSNLTDKNLITFLPKKRTWESGKETKEVVEVLNSPYKRIRLCHTDENIQPKKCTSFTVKAKEMQAFFQLFTDDEILASFLTSDTCFKITDKYLLAMTFAYFKRASFSIREYNRTNFFTALYLSNDMEEDEEDFKYEIFPWALGRNWRKRYPSFLLRRDHLWKRIGYRAVVSRKCCEEIMAIQPDHPLWKRTRAEHHGGAYREYTRGPDENYYPRGPWRSPIYCNLCDENLEYDSASPDSISSWLIAETSSNESSPAAVCVFSESRFDMHGLKLNLPTEEWPLALTGSSTHRFTKTHHDDTIWARGYEE